MSNIQYIWGKQMEPYLDCDKVKVRYTKNRIDQYAIYMDYGDKGRRDFTLTTTSVDHTRASEFMKAGTHKIIKRKENNKMKYVLKANAEGGTHYYMNIICVTHEARDAMHYATKEDAQKDMEHFKNMFHYEEVQPIIEEYKGE